jgi:hypothetical protein
MIDLPPTIGKVPRPGWMPDWMTIDGNLIPMMREPPRDRYGLIYGDSHAGMPYAGKLPIATQEAIRELWKKTFDTKLCCARFEINAMTLVAITSGG